jgi:hypothetical protein
MHSSRQLVITVGLLISCLLYSSYDVNAATINAASCSSSDVVTAIGTAITGDTVIIPACTATAWASAISLTKQITVQGACHRHCVFAQYGRLFRLDDYPEWAQFQRVRDGHDENPN